MPALILPFVLSCRLLRDTIQTVKTIQTGCARLSKPRKDIRFGKRYVIMIMVQNRDHWVLFTETAAAARLGLCVMHRDRRV